MRAQSAAVLSAIEVKVARGALSDMISSCLTRDRSRSVAARHPVPTLALRGEVPLVSFGIARRVHAIAPWSVGGVLLDRRAAGARLSAMGVDVVHVGVDCGLHGR